jgi:hypothetical protein
VRLQSKPPMRNSQNSKNSKEKRIDVTKGETANPR